MPSLKVDDILISYELDQPTDELPMVVVYAKDGENLIVLKVISEAHGAVSINKLISEYVASKELL